MTLETLPVRTAGAAENMAADFLLLRRHPRPAVVRFRHYGWRAPAFTFGYSQRIAFVREQLAAAAAGEVRPPELCRRPTGGGVVDHRDDWTYALVIPRGHALEEQRASESYRAVHEALATVLRAHGVPAVTKPAADPGAEEDGPAGVCFQRAEVHDVVHAVTGAKIAGAAQKRSRDGLLFQGSVWRPAAGEAVPWEPFADLFSTALAATLGAEATPTPWPDFPEGELEALTEQYSTPEWNEFR